MTPLRFCLIGVGGIGAYHLRSIQMLSRAGEATLAAVADPTMARFPDMLRELEAGGVRQYASYQELLENEPELDAVTIATPIPYHYEMARACIERGLFVNLEKPPVPLVQQLDELIRLDRAHRVSVGFQMIGSTCVRKLKSLITSGELGTIRAIRAAGCWPRHDNYYLRANWAGRMALNGDAVFDGPATNALAHLIHNIMFLAGEGAHGFAVPENVEAEVYRARPIESYDLAALRGRFAGGPEFSVVVTHATEQKLPFRLAVEGDAGWALLSDDGGKLATRDGEICNAVEPTQLLIDRNYWEFVAAIRDGSHRFPTRLEDARGYVMATNAMLVSSGGIRDVNPSSIRRYSVGEDMGFDVNDLHDDVEATLQSGRLPSEWGRDWAIAQPKSVRLSDLTALSLS